MKDLSEEPEEESSIWDGPLKYIVALFLLFLLVLWIVPAYTVRFNPAPRYIAMPEEVIPTFELGNETGNEVYRREEFPGMIAGNDPVVKQTADRIVALSGCGEHTTCQARALFYFVRDRFTSVSDPYAYEYVKTAKESLTAQGGDCDDASILLASLLQAVGFRTRFVFVPNHVYVQVWIQEAPKKYKTEQQWITTDATCRYCEFGERTLSSVDAEKQYFGG